MSSLALKTGTLHLVVNLQGLLRAVDLCAAGDSILLMQQATHLALENVPTNRHLHRVLQTCRCFVLEVDLNYSAIAIEQINAQVNVISDAQWLQLTITHPRCITWS